MDVDRKSAKVGDGLSYGDAGDEKMNRQQRSAKPAMMMMLAAVAPVNGNGDSRDDGLRGGRQRTVKVVVITGDEEQAAMSSDDRNKGSGDLEINHWRRRQPASSPVSPVWFPSEWLPPAAMPSSPPVRNASGLVAAVHPPFPPPTLTSSPSLRWICGGSVVYCRAWGTSDHRKPSPTVGPQKALPHYMFPVGNSNPSLIGLFSAFGSSETQTHHRRCLFLDHRKLKLKPTTVGEFNTLAAAYFLHLRCGFPATINADSPLRCLSSLSHSRSPFSLALYLTLEQTAASGCCLLPSSPISSS